MTIGIYRLVFENTNKCYVGQSVHIEKRFKEHLYSFKTETATSKLLEAYKVYGVPELEILVECSASELDIFEDEAIEIFQDNFNTYTTANQAPYGKGTESGNSKYTKEQLIQVFQLLTTSISLLEIGKLTGVERSTIYKVSIGLSHLWLQELFPEAQDKILLENFNRKAAQHVQAAEHNKNTYCASAKGIIYPPIQCPEGHVYIVHNVQQFARDHNIPKSSLHRVLTKESKQVKGWTLCQEEHQ